MDDEEIDRIFHDATKSCESPPLSTLPSPPESITNKSMDVKSRATFDDTYDWQYKLPSPPKAFRDQTNSPTTTAATEYDTVTAGGLIFHILPSRFASNALSLIFSLILTREGTIQKMLGGCLLVIKFEDGFVYYRNRWRTGEMENMLASEYLKENMSLNGGKNEVAMREFIWGGISFL